MFLLTRDLFLSPSFLNGVWMLRFFEGLWSSEISLSKKCFFFFFLKFFTIIFWAQERIPSFTLPKLQRSFHTRNYCVYNQNCSSTLIEEETKNSTVEKEALAAVWGIDYYRPYLFCRTLLVIIGHSCLKYLQQFKNSNNRIVRWILARQEYSF